MEFTGERYVPGAAGQEELYIEHMSRYHFARSLAAGHRVLDVGSGCGYGTHHLAAGGAEFTLGIDISAEAVAYAQASYRHPRLCFTVMDASKLSLSGRFGLITCFELIEHVDDAEGVLRGVHQVLDESGVFVVSTPNKATYVAGGEGGENPFHVREYYREEFDDLLGRAFPAVRILGQHWVEGMALRPHPDLRGCGEIRAGRLPGDKDPSRGPAADTGAISSSRGVGVVESGLKSDCPDSGAESRLHPDCLAIATETRPNSDCTSAGVVGSDLHSNSAGSGEPRYFIAICAKQPVLDNIITKLEPLAFYDRTVRYDSLKKAACRLEREFDRRGAWAQGLEQECRAKDKTIRDLQRELENLRNSFDERGRWAERLNSELRQSGALVDRLAEENRHLRESLAARRQAGWNKVAK